MQIAALFHDAARENEDKDEWDHESGLLVYYYLTQTLNVSHKTAVRIAEAIANKDINPKGYFKIVLGEHGVEGIFDPQINKDNFIKPIEHKILHDLDCLDIVRARSAFDMSYLDFYKQIAQYECYETAFEELAELLCEARSLVAIMGDTYRLTNPLIKKKYEHADIYSAISTILKQYPFKIINLLSQKLLKSSQLKQLELVDLTPFNPEAGLHQENVNRALREGKIFARGLIYPSGILKDTTNRKEKPEETCTYLELRKDMRTLGIPTRSQKSSNILKHGNPKRSASIIGNGSNTLYNSCFFKINVPLKDLYDLHLTDIGSGRGKKNHLDDNKIPISEQNLHDFIKKMKTGGATIRFQAFDFDANHTEVIMHIKNNFDGILYSQDPNLFNVDVHRTPDLFHPYIAILQAFYIRKAYEESYDATYKKFLHTLGQEEGHKQFLSRFGTVKILPIFEYSGLHNFFVRIEENRWTEEYLIKLWCELCEAFMLKKLAYNHFGVERLTVHDIKIMAMYGNADDSYMKRYEPADSNYPIELQEKINNAIGQVRQRIIENNINPIIKKIKSNRQMLLDNEVFLWILKNPSILDLLKTDIELLLQEPLTLSDFENKTPSNIFYSKKYIENQFYNIELMHKGIELQEQTLYVAKGENGLSIHLKNDNKVYCIPAAILKNLKIPYDKECIVDENYVRQVLKPKNYWLSIIVDSYCRSLSPFPGYNVFHYPDEVEKMYEPTEISGGIF
ncbi:MAG: hypothetical protein HYX60_11600 [Legionella longbeachae]|nr:hypothetical protein [Legionella longbeachae]